MSAYVVNMETISVLAKALVEYGCDDFAKGNYDGMAMILVNERYKPVGQMLLEQNYKSVNYRYSETTETPEFEYVEIPDEDFNIGTIYGCIRCYEYQACETPDYWESKIHYAMNALEIAMLEREIKRNGYEIPWGYEPDVPFN